MLLIVDFELFNCKFSLSVERDVINHAILWNELDLRFNASQKVHI